VLFGLAVFFTVKVKVTSGARGILSTWTRRLLARPAGSGTATSPGSITDPVFVESDTTPGPMNSVVPPVVGRDALTPKPPVRMLTGVNTPKAGQWTGVWPSEHDPVSPTMRNPRPAAFTHAWTALGIESPKCASDGRGAPTSSAVSPRSGTTGSGRRYQGVCLSDGIVISFLALAAPHDDMREQSGRNPARAMGFEQGR